MARIISFRAEYGTSVEIGGKWHKLYSAIEIAPDEQDDPQEIRTKAWNTVYNEIEKQIREL